MRDTETDSTFDRDLDRVRTAIFAFMGICAMIGLVLLVVSVAGNAVVEAFLALFVTLGLCALAGLGLLGVRLARRVSKLQSRSDALRYRIDALEAAFDAQGFDTELPVPGTHHTSELLSASLPEAQYPRLVKSRFDEGAAHASADTAPVRQATTGAAHTEPASDRRDALCDQFQLAIENDDLPEARRTLSQVEPFLEREQRDRWRSKLESFTNRVRGELRDGFHAALTEGDHSEAIQIGEQIIELFPHSRMARDFARIRSALNNSDSDSDGPQQAQADAG